jgi:hypothetical protein
MFLGVMQRLDGFRFDFAALVLQLLRRQNETGSQASKPGPIPILSSFPKAELNKPKLVAGFADSQPCRAGFIRA